MNYRHHFHAGNFADVMKHALLVQLIRAMQRKEKGFLYLDTHAGAGRYDLAVAGRGDSLERKPEHPNGIGRLWTRTGLPAPLAEYVALVLKFNRQEGAVGDHLRFYPGSPWIANLLARTQDRLALADLHPEDGAALAREFALALGVKVHAMDGYTSLKALLPPFEKRALVLIDPPYEAQDEFAQIVRGVADALRRFRSGVYAIWYPLTARARTDEFHRALVDLAPPPMLAVEITIAGDQSAIKLKGCGLIVINSPWRFDGEIGEWLPVLAGLLEQEPGAHSRVEWLVKEPVGLRPPGS